jgi:hypothetical protein
MSDLRLLSMESLFLASVSGLLTIKSLAGLGLSQAVCHMHTSAEATAVPVAILNRACTVGCLGFGHGSMGPAGPRAHPR